MKTLRKSFTLRKQVAALCKGTLQVWLPSSAYKHYWQWTSICTVIYLPIARSPWQTESMYCGTKGASTHCQRTIFWSTKSANSTHFCFSLSGAETAKDQWSMSRSCTVQLIRNSKSSKEKNNMEADKQECTFPKTQIGQECRRPDSAAPTSSPISKFVTSSF